MGLEIEDVKVWNAIVFHFCADRPGFWPSAAPRHIITESASHHVKKTPAQHRTHASAWEIWIFEVENSVTHEVSCCFPRFSHFLIVGWFWWWISIPWHVFLTRDGPILLLDRFKVKNKEIQISPPGVVSESSFAYTTFWWQISNSELKLRWPNAKDGI